MAVKLPLSKKDVEHRNLVMTVDGQFQDLVSNLRKLKLHCADCFTDITYDNMIQQYHADFVKRIVTPLTE